MGIMIKVLQKLFFCFFKTLAEDVEGSFHPGPCALGKHTRHIHIYNIISLDYGDWQATSPYQGNSKRIPCISGYSLDLTPQPATKRFRSGFPTKNR